MFTLSFITGGENDVPRQSRVGRERIFKVTVKMTDWGDMPLSLFDLKPINSS
jgi:hypothetical protein